MIIGFFLSILLAILQWIVNLLPTIAFPTQIPQGLTLFWGYMNLFSMVQPVGTILTVLVIAFLYLGAKYVWLFIHWVLRRLPFTH